MQINSKKFSVFLGLLLCFSMCFAAFAGQATTKKKKKATVPDTTASAEPDKVLYNRAMIDYKKGRYTEERLSLQTLINTYPDSEYLAKAKLGVGDSYYKEGGVSNLTQSIAEYKDFITFFPFLEESSYAQMQVAMAHYRMMEKADRDTSQAQEAETEFQAFLLKYPQSPLTAKAQQHLRDVQEVLAEGEFRIAAFYYLKGPRSYRAALARLNEINERYPLYSQADRSLWMAANIYDKAERRETADQLYARIVKEYPSSRYAPDSKRKLASAGVPIPIPDENAIARAKENKVYAEKREALVKKPMGMIHTGPDVTHAAHAGEPNLTPPEGNESATDVLRPGAGGPSFSTGGAGGGTGNSVAVETVPAGSSSGGTGETQPGIQPGTTSNPPPVGAAPNTAPTSSDESSLPAPMTPESGEAAAPAPTDPNAVPAAGSDATTPRPIGDSKEDTETRSDAEAAAVHSSDLPPAPAKGSANGAATGTATNSTANGTASAANGTAAATDSSSNGSAAAAPANSTNGNSASANSTDANKGTSSEQASASSGKADPNAESSSNKKKGIKKLIPW